MKKPTEYEKLYFDLKKQFDYFLKHKRHDIRKCRYDREWHEGCLKSLRYIKDKKMKEMLYELFETLWLNNCLDFDVIYYTFAERIMKERRCSKH